VIRLAVRESLPRLQVEADNRLVDHAAHWATLDDWVRHVEDVVRLPLRARARSSFLGRGTRLPASGLAVLLGLRDRSDPWMVVVDGAWSQIAVQRSMGRDASAFDRLRPLDEAELGTAEYLVLQLLARAERTPFELLDLARRPQDFLRFGREPHLARFFEGALGDAPGSAMVAVPLTLPRPSERSTARPWSRLRPIRTTVRALLGTAVLRLEHLDRLGPGDVLLPTRRQPGLSLHVGRADTPRWQGRRTGGRHLYLEPTMTDEAPIPTDDTDVIDVLSEIPVEVSLELARRTMSAADVLAIKPGQVVAFDRSLEGPVDLYIGDHRLGRGHLVDIEGQAGVRVEVVFDGEPR
jgi:flagellar motor switch protein FliN/FliY